ncbi:delta-VPH [Vibrio metoecus]|uniref:thermostable hemolysin n=1 Tax=Vibrio metoecus TaxID=1481663 RepID=UPI0006D80EBF|nr:thermostable hemolysin [Vibrio metoecus]KQB04707.1 delta-VPH [Vibrio metoecus]PAR50707.1 delta-VPH [Vibrio metoecus]PAR54768.1 delta-VPH [Vibrio metoecus]
MKHLPCLSDLTLEVITPMHPRWNEATALVRERYQQAFDAHLTAYMPAYLALLDHNEMKSVCGFRIAEQESLFLEQYLDQPADEILAQRFACSIPRGKLIEFGHLASFGRGLSAFHFLLIAQQLVAMGFEWCIFTATDPLHALMRRFGLQPTLIAKASSTRIPNASQVWGTYYQHSPRILAGNLAQGCERLNQLSLNQKQA